MIKQLDGEIAKVAINFNRYSGIVNCKPEKKDRCHEILQTQRTLIIRLDKLMGWERKVSAPQKTAVKNSDVQPPCPSKEELDKMQAVRYFHKKLYKTWERCVSLNPENYYK